MLNPSLDQVREAILYLIAFVLSVSVHEFGHAWAANRLGDATPRNQGRLTLSPLHHIDLLGTIILPRLGRLATPPLPLIAWGRPVRYDPLSLSRRFSLKTGQMLVAVAGPLMNIVMALAVSVVAIAAAWLGAPKELVLSLWNYLIVLNIMLLCFNLLPIPPLDGGMVLAWLLPRSMQHVVDSLRRWGIYILILLMLINSQLPVLRWMLYPMEVLAGLWARGLAMALPSHL